MKSRLLCASTTLLTALALLASSSPRGFAQQQPPRQFPTRPQRERPIIEVQAQPVLVEEARIAVPPQCLRANLDVQTHDVADKFAPPGSPVSLSPALASYFTGRNLTPKGYDDPRVNMVFADSFRLRSCRICHATLEVGVRHYGDLWDNDTITSGLPPFTTSSGTIFMYGGIWNPNGPNANPKTATFTLSAAALNQHVMSGPVPSFLDLIAQDDSDFDYAKLSVWYY